MSVLICKKCNKISGTWGLPFVGKPNYNKDHKEGKCSIKTKK